MRDMEKSVDNTMQIPPASQKVSEAFHRGRVDLTRLKSEKFEKTCSIGSLSTIPGEKPSAISRL